MSQSRWVWRLGLRHLGLWLVRAVSGLSHTSSVAIVLHLPDARCHTARVSDLPTRGDVLTLVLVRRSAFASAETLRLETRLLDLQQRLLRLIPVLVVVGIGAVPPVSMPLVLPVGLHDFSICADDAKKPSKICYMKAASFPATNLPVCAS